MRNRLTCCVFVDLLAAAAETRLTGRPPAAIESIDAWQPPGPSRLRAASKARRATAGEGQERRHQYQWTDLTGRAPQQRIGGATWRCQKAQLNSRSQLASEHEDAVATLEPSEHCTAKSFFSSVGFVRHANVEECGVWLRSDEVGSVAIPGIQAVVTGSPGGIFCPDLVHRQRVGHGTEACQTPGRRLIGQWATPSGVEVGAPPIW
eukprot:3757399-Prymnesium_polylepis.1